MNCHQEPLVKASQIKRVYGKPSLVTIGVICELTAGGSLGTAENDGQTGNCKGKPTLPCTLA